MKIGEKVNHLTLIERIEKRGREWYGLFECDCEDKVRKVIRITAVSGGNTKSCGHHRREICKENGKKAITHGLSNHFLFRLWQRILQSCNPNVVHYLGYTICDEWKDFQKFYDWCIQNGWEQGKTITRKNLDLEYSPDNCLVVLKNEAKIKATTYTSLKKYGVEHQTKADIVKEKVKKTNLAKYGVPASSQSEIVKQKTIENNIKKYGVEFPQQLEENREKFRQATIERGQAKVYQGKTGSQWAEEKGFSVSWFNKMIRNYGYEFALTEEPHQSNIEKILEKFLIEENISYQTHIKIDNKIADFVINNIIIEVDGLFWHCDRINRDIKYHYKKQLLYKKYGYESLFFREDEINNKFDIVKSIILHRLNKTKNRIFARKCEIKEVLYQDSKMFLNENHLMGNFNGSKQFGLYHNNELVALLQIKYKNNIIDISRFCTKKYLNVIGGFSRLLNYMIITEKPKIITNFVDKRYGTGKHLEQFGFIKETEYLSFRWIKNDQSFHRRKYPRNTGYEVDCYKLWDCGQAKYVKYIL